MKDNPESDRDRDVSKMFRRGRPAGTPSPDTIKKRARELAEIDGRNPDQVTRGDMERALEELQRLAARGGGQLDVAEGEDARDSSDPSAGHAERKPKYVGDDESQYGRELTLQGVEEAEHEQMLRARREGGHQEGT